LKWKEKFFFLCPAGTTEFDRLWSKILEIRNFELWHRLNAHHVRYLCIKS
jgi:hypothetical protein